MKRAPIKTNRALLTPASLPTLVKDMKTAEEGILRLLREVTE